jgi:putative transposase
MHCPQIRTSLRYVPEKDKKAVVADLKPIYKPINQEQGYEKLLELEDKWVKNIRCQLRAG